MTSPSKHLTLLLLLASCGVDEAFDESTSQSALGGSGVGYSLRHGIVPIQTTKVSSTSSNTYYLKDTFNTPGVPTQVLSALDVQGFDVFPAIPYTSSNNEYGNSTDMTDRFSLVMGPFSQTGETSGVDAMFGLTFAFLLYKEVGLDGPFLNGDGVRALVHEAPGFTRWLFQSKEMRLARSFPGSKCGADTEMWRIASLMAHGFFQTVVVTGPYGNSGELAALAEANSMIFAKVTEIFASQKMNHPTEDPLPQIGTDWEIRSCGAVILDLPAPNVELWDPHLHTMPPFAAAGPAERMFYLLSLDVGIRSALTLWTQALAKSGGNPGLDYAMLRELMRRVAKPMGLATVNAVDNAWNAVGVGSVADTSKPQIDAKDYFVKQGKPVTVVVTDNELVDTVSYPWAIGVRAPFTTTYPYAGTRTLPVTANDFSGNVATKNVRFVHDSLPPTFNNVGHGFQHTNSRQGFMSLSWLFDPSKLELSAKVGPTVVASTIREHQSGTSFQTETIPVLLPENLYQGTHDLVVTVGDTLGNTAPPVVKPFVWDTVNPELCELVNVPVRFAPSDTIHAQGRDMTSGLRTAMLKIDGVYVPPSGQTNSSPGATINMSFPFTNLTSGTHEVTLQCTDMASNATPHTRSVRVSRRPTHTINVTNVTQNRIDLNGPVTDDDVVQGVTLSASCTASGARPSVTLANPSATTAFSWTHSFTGLTPGETCTVTATATDPWGFTGTQSRSVTVAEACGSPLYSGGLTPASYMVYVGRSSGRFDFTREMFQVPDNMTITCDGSGTINSGSSYSTGCVSGGAIGRVDFNCPSQRVRVSVAPDCQGQGSTQWNFTVGCGY